MNGAIVLLRYPCLCHIEVAGLNNFYGGMLLLGVAIVECIILRK